MSTISVPLDVASQEAAVPAAPAAGACPSCGTALVGDFCHACGEGNPAVEDRSLRHFYREVADELTLDSRVLRTLRLLITQPGELTLEYLRGRRRPYVGPLRFYLVVFAVTIILATLLESVQTQSQGAADGFIEAQIAALQNAVAQAQDITPEEARRVLNDRTAGLITWFSVGIPLIFAVFLQLVYRRPRRWFTEHLVYATHFATLNYVVGILFLPIQFAAGEAAAIPVGLAGAALVWIYLYLSLRRVYEASRLGTAVRTVVLVVGFSIGSMVTGMLALCTAAVRLIYF